MPTVTESAKAELNAKENSRWRYPLFDPTRIFKGFARILGPIRGVVWLLWPVTALAVVAIWHGWYRLLADTTQVFGAVSVIEKLLVSMITANLLGKWIQGTVISYLGGKTPEFGIQLVLGFVPRFYLELSHVRRMSFRLQRSCYAAPLQMRLAIFAVGMLTWAMLRSSGSSAADYMLVFGWIGLGSFLFTMNPLFPADGYRWMSAYLKRPKLRNESFQVIKLMLSRRRLPAGLGEWEKWALVAFVVLSIAYLAACFALIVRAVATGLEASFNGTGVFLACIMLAIMTVYLIDKLGELRKSPALKRAKRKGGRDQRSRAGVSNVTSTDSLEDAFFDSDPNEPIGGGQGMKDKRYETLTARERNRLRQSESDSDKGGLGGAPLPRSGVAGADADRPVGHPPAEDKTVAAVAARARVDARRSSAGSQPPDDRRVAPKSPERPVDLELGGLTDTFAGDPADEEFDFGIVSGPAGQRPPQNVETPPSTANDAMGQSRGAGESAPPGRPTPAPPLRAPGEARADATGVKDRIGEMSARVGRAIEPATERARAAVESTASRARAAIEPITARTGKDADVGPRARSPEGDGGTSKRRASPNIEALLSPKSSDKSPEARRKTLLIWAIVVTAVLFVALLPYPFRVGGEFTIEPVERAEVRARVSGEVLDLLVKEGDWVTKGQVMARLSDWDQEHAISLREADIAQGRAELDTLVTGHRPEEIALAKQRVVSAGVTADYSLRELERKRELFSRDVGAQAEVDLAEGRYEVAVAEQDVALANLAVIEAPALASEIAAAEAKIERDAKDLEYQRLRAEYANIRAVADGQIVTPLEQFSVGTYLPVGGLFAELEDNRTVLAEIEIPETDVNEVLLGAEVELVLWSSPWESFYGEVVRISPRAEEKEFGRVVRVLVEVPNPDGRLATNITGHGKILAESRPVWEAFTRAFVRFFKVEIWSWLP